MLFNSARYLIFLPIVLLGYYVIPRRVRYLWLLAASYYFYMCWNAKYALLMLFSTAVTYVCGLSLSALQRRGARAQASPDSPGAGTRTAQKWIVAAGFVLCLGVLFLFKYYGFADRIVSRVFALAGLSLHLPAFDVLLPIGISFYTLQALGYLMDVYRGQIAAERNFFRYALFVSFFPQLVAGPIERSGSLLSQLRDDSRRFDLDKAREGLLLILWGFFLKLVLADRIAAFVDTVFGSWQTYAGWRMIVGIALFAVQIYCDFCGYSTIAVGSAKLLGIDLMENFDAPFLSTSIARLWSRWHISLTSWFKDYLYIPLGGNRCSRPRNWFNKIFVCFVSGLWHGANFTFAIWGTLNGVFQVLGEILKPLRDRLVKLFGLDRASLGHQLASGAFTFFLFCFSLVFFRSEGVRAALQILKGMFLAKDVWVLFDGSLFQCGMHAANFRLMMLCIGLLTFADVCRRKGIVIRKVILAQDWWFRWAFIALSVTFLLVFGVWGGGYDAANFIYFQF